MQIDLNRFLDTFFIEAAEHLEQMEGALLQLENNCEDKELLNTIFRSAHSMKGASLTFGLEDVAKFTHILESLLDRLRDGQIAPNEELVGLLLVSVDILDALIANAKDGAPLPSNLIPISEQLTQAINADPTKPETPSVRESSIATSEVRVFEIKFIPSQSILLTGQDPLLLVAELINLGEVIQANLVVPVELDLFQLNTDECHIAWEITLRTESQLKDIQDIFLFLDNESTVTVTLAENLAECSEIDSLPATNSVETANQTNQTDTTREVASQNRTNARTEGETIRVDKNRLDDLINQIGELVIGTSMVEQEARERANISLDSLGSLNKIVRDLQELSLGLRMVPLAGIFQKLNRVVRDTAKKIGKEIELITEGDDTELDKTVVDQIGDPLIHMVRNAVDHGIELPNDREVLGKPRVGKVTLRAFQQGGSVYVQLQDDGKGLNRSRIKEKAIERGLISADSQIAEQEIDNLIFLPGFSTADSVTEISGRGVGMDVVRRNVEALQGSISIKSEQGIGTTITVRLPLTLAILDGLLLSLGNEVFVIPLLSVIESIRIRPGEVKNITSVGEVISLRGEIVPLIRLASVFSSNHSSDSIDQILVVIVEDEGKKIALAIDDLIGQQQIVVKNLEANFKKVRGIAGATILGDGRVALIVDIAGLLGYRPNEELDLSSLN